MSDQPNRRLVQRESHNGWIRLTLDRPEKKNAITVGMLRELAAHVSDAEDEGIGVVVLDSQGPDFSAGGDLKEAMSSLYAPGGWRQMLTQWRGTLELLEFCRPVVVVGAQGRVIAGALELALACDWIVAEESTTFADTHAVAGMIPGGSLTWRLPRRVGPAVAMEMMMVGEPISAADALCVGIVNHVVADGQLEAKLVATASTLAERDPETLAQIKRLARSGVEMSRRDAAETEYRAVVSNIQRPAVRDPLDRRWKPTSP